MTSWRSWTHGMAQVAELRIFGGLTGTEVAEALGLGLGTVQLDWKMARARLGDTLEVPGGPAADNSWRPFRASS